MRPFLKLAALCLLAAGCKVDIDFANTRFMCADGTCPGGYQCVDEVCVLSDDAGSSDDGDGGGAGSADGAPVLQACDVQFGAAPGYQLCVENGDSCEFFYATGDGTQITCDEVCPSYGATCNNSFDSAAGTECVRQTEDGCAVAHSSQICICTRNPATN